jgi:hypothetical protein
MLYTYAATAVIACTLGFGSAWQVQSWRHGANERDRIEAEAQAQREQAKRTHTINEARDAESLRLQSELADALERLRNRPAVRMQQTPASCAGASPAVISAEDGSVVVRLAAEADQLRKDYAACRSWVEEVSGTPER